MTVDAMRITTRIMLEVIKQADAQFALKVYGRVSTEQDGQIIEFVTFANNEVHRLRSKFVYDVQAIVEQDKIIREFMRQVEEIADYVCTCTDACVECTGQCGCKGCHNAYADYLSGSGDW